MWNVVWCAVPEMWFDVTCYWVVVVICGRYNHIAIASRTSSHYHHSFTLHHSTSNTISDIIPNHTTFHVTPYRTSTSRSTLFHFAIPYFKSHHIVHIMHHTTDISHCTLFHITDVPHNATSVSDHIIYWPHHLCAPPHFTQHCTAFHMLHILHQFHIWLWSHLILHRTTMFHIAFHITRQYTTTFYIPPLVTSRITPSPLTRIAPCHSPHTTSSRSTSRNVPHSMPQHTLTPTHITPPLSITPF